MKFPEATRLPPLRGHGPDASLHPVTTPHQDPALERLLALSPSESAPFLLELARRQAEKRGPRELLEQRERDLFVAPSALDQRTLHAFDGIAFQAGIEFEALALSPVAPLGVCSRLAPTSQDRTLSATRGLEVVSDPTNVLALECARRLALDADSRVSLSPGLHTIRVQNVHLGFSEERRVEVRPGAVASLAIEPKPAAPLETAVAPPPADAPADAPATAGEPVAAP